MKFRSPFTSRSTTRSGHSLAYVGEIHELSALSGDETVVLLGQTVIMSLDAPTEIGSNAYIPQPIRESRRKDFSFAALRQPSRLLYSSIHPDVAHHIASQPKPPRIVLPADAIFALAARQTRNDALLICNGYEAHDQTYLDTYFFRHGQLLHITEATLKPSGHPRFLIDVKQHLASVLADFPTARILWTAPLTPIELDGYPLEPVGPEIYNANYAPVTHDGKTTPKSPKLPVVAVLLTLAACFIAGALDINALSQKRAIYDHLSQQTPGSTSTVALEVLQARAEWQRETDLVPASQRLASANQLLAAVAGNPDLRITRLSIATRRSSETATPSIAAPVETSAISLTLTTPIQPSLQATDQVQPIVAALSQKVGTKLTVKQQGIAPTTTSDSNRLRIIIDADNP